MEKFYLLVKLSALCKTSCLCFLSFAFLAIFYDSTISGGRDVMIDTPCAHFGVLPAGK